MQKVLPDVNYGELMARIRHMYDKCDGTYFRTYTKAGKSYNERGTGDDVILYVLSVCVPLFYLKLIDTCTECV